MKSFFFNVLLSRNSRHTVISSSYDVLHTFKKQRAQSKFRAEGEGGGRPIFTNCSYFTKVLSMKYISAFLIHGIFVLRSPIHKTKENKKKCFINIS